MNRKRVRRLYRACRACSSDAHAPTQAPVPASWVGSVGEVARTSDRVWTLSTTHCSTAAVSGADGRRQYSRQSPLLEPVFAHWRERFRRLGADGKATRLPRLDHGRSRHRIHVQGARGMGVATGIKLDFIRPGKPNENAHVESFNGRLRDECLNVAQFTSLEHARRRIEAWRSDYNNTGHHSALRPPDPARIRQARSADEGSRGGHFQL